MENLVLSVVGKDRVGMISELSAAVSECGGNWLESMLANMSGTFAGAVLISTPKERHTELEQRLAALEGMTVTVISTADVTPLAGQPCQIEVVGNDRPGIVAEITRTLKDGGATIHELQTQTYEAPMDNSVLFEANILVELTADTTPEALQASLESLAAEFQVDVDFVDTDTVLDDAPEGANA